MSTAFPFVEIPPEMADIIGQREGDSRVYARVGTQEECSHWYDAVHEIAGMCVSPGGVAMFCPVSRAATHKRIKEGRLSCFTFYVKERKINFFGKLRGDRATPYAHVPVSECKAWKKELEEKAIRNELVTREELEGVVPDWRTDFLDLDSAWRKEQRKLGGPRNIELKVMVSPRENEVLEKAVKKLHLHFKTKEELITHWINYTTRGGMAGIAFIKLGFRMARLFEESERLKIEKK